MKLFKLFIIPLLLVVGYLVLFAYPYFFSKVSRFNSLGPLSLVEKKYLNFEKTYSPMRVTDQLDNHLLSGEKISGKIKATENNFGILLFRFAKLSGKVEDSIVFKIKEEKSQKWYYEHNYKADQFWDNEYFTFGFPPFKNSKNNTYVFEIESLAGTYKNGIGWSKVSPQVAIVYKYNVEQLKDLRTLSSFIIKKFIYALNNLSFLQWLQILTSSFFSYIIILLINKKRAAQIFVKGFLPRFEWRFHKQALKKIIYKAKLNYLIQKKTIVKFLKKLKSQFTTTQFYFIFFDTNLKKRVLLGLLIFLIAFLFRFTPATVDHLGVVSFYSGLGGQGDYDQFIRAATCALKFCPAILGQNFLIESSILGVFYGLFGFTGGLKAYLYLMIIFSSVIATLPYLLLSRKRVNTIGGIIGSLFLASSDYLIHISINLPPDNLSLFTFSIFFIIYLLTLNKGTIRWLLFLGLVGTIDGLNKLIILINNVAVMLFFVPIFLYDRAKKIKRFPFIKLTPGLIFYSLLPFLVFLVIYSAWEVIVQIKFSTPYYLRSLIEGGSVYASSTDAGAASLKDILSKGVLETLYYYVGLTIVMQERIIEYSGLNTFFLAPIFLGLLYFTLRRVKFFIVKLVSVVIFLVVVLILLALFRENSLKIQEVGMYVYAWPNSNYTNIFFFTGILFLFFLNFKYSALRLILPILPYYLILIILTKNAPWGRMWVHVVVWIIILFGYLIDWILSNTKRHNLLKGLSIAPIIFVIFIIFHMTPKTASMLGQLYSGVINTRDEVRYLSWVNTEIPKNAIIVGGGKSDLVAVAENIHRPIIYNSLWTTALLIRPNEIPLVKPTDFAILDQLKITKMSEVTSSDFSLIQDLKNEDNLKRNKYILLEDDISLWRNRMLGVDDSVFATSSATLLHANNYTIKMYKFNPALNKGIYELKFKTN
ncbi:hypothetical protein HZA75_01925 [Candidatus Roizmanbacteria bacterium]|nr:hypothetical protein [Candidatus Roizmanbacteria bacterium]